MCVLEFFCFRLRYMLMVRFRFSLSEFFDIFMFGVYEVIFDIGSWFLLNLYVLSFVFGMIFVLINVV